ncbi:MAG: hypothetical protein ABI277_05905 [Burkholderiaceae bacterium]
MTVLIGILIEAAAQAAPPETHAARAKALAHSRASCMKSSFLMAFFVGIGDAVGRSTDVTKSR